MSEGLPLHWRLIPQRYSLIGTKCTTCGDSFFPPRKLCPNCRRKGKIEDYKFSGKGEIESYTIAYSLPKGFGYMRPMIVAIVKLAEGPLVTTQIVDAAIEDIHVGRKVESCFRKVIEDGKSGIIRYAYKFRLAE